MTLTQINKAGLDEIALDHVFTIGASGSSAYTFQGEGLNGTVNNPTLYLTRGKTYRFENGSGGHPIRIQSTSGASGTAYNTGVTNNAGSGTVIVEVQHDAPDVLYYQCTSHAAMNGILYITGALADGGVTTAKIADDAVTSAKIADATIIAGNLASNSVTTSQIANNVITDAKINPSAAIAGSKLADDSISLAKLEHGTSSNDGKFLRANNGADPSFETVSIPAGTTINNNADNRVITGSGTANTLNGESGVQIDSSGRLLINGTDANAVHTNADDVIIGNTSASVMGLSIVTSTSGYGTLQFSDGGGNKNQGQFAYNHSNNSMIFTTAESSRMTIDSSGKVGIGTTSPPAALHLHYGTDPSVNIFSTQHTQNTGSKINFGVGQSASSGGNTGCRIEHNIPNSGGAMSGELKFYTNNGDSLQERLRIQAGGGISFNGDSAAANALDSYEEGSWTPDLRFGGGNTSLVYTSRTGKYIKIGGIVVARFGIKLQGRGSSTGNARIYGLPYAGVHGSYYHDAGATIMTDGGTNSSGGHTLVFVTESTRLSIRQGFYSNANYDSDHNAFTNSTSLFGTVVYNTIA